MHYHPLQIASSVQPGVILWTSGNDRLYYKVVMLTTLQPTLHYQVEKSQLGEKCIQE